MSIRKIFSYTFIFVLFCVATAGGDERPMPTKVSVLDLSCFQLVYENGIYVGRFAWAATGPNGTWQCAPNNTLSFPQPPSVTKTPVWTADDSDKQLTYFRSEVENSIVAAVKDNIVTKAQVDDFISTTMNTELKKAVDDELQAKRQELIRDVAAEVKKQQEAQAPSPTASGPNTPKN